MGGRYDRPDVKQVTKQWVKENCKSITERDMGLLRLLHDNKRRLLRRDQIEILYPVFASTDRLNKRLKSLFQMHIIDKVYPPVGLGEGMSKQHICLDRAGAILLGLEKFNKVLGPSRSLPLGWEHKVMLNSYECTITQLLKETQGDMVIYEVEEPQLYKDTKIIPDILCLFKFRGKGYLFFIEVDMGTEDIPYIKCKLDAYKDFYVSQQWLSRPWAKMFKTPTFPRVLFITENDRPKRIQTLQEYTSESSVRFMYGSHKDLRSILEGIIRG